MAISAYDPSGRLKKHFLLGTSFATDPEKSLERQNLQKLYEESRSAAGGGRETMLSRLAPRLESYATQESGRLAELAAKKQGFEQAYANLANPELQQKFQDYQDVIEQGRNLNPNAFIRYTDIPTASGEPLKAPSGIPEDILKQASEQWQAMTIPQRVEWSQTHEHPGEKLFNPPKPGGGIKISPSDLKRWRQSEPLAAGQLAQNLWREQYGPEAQAAHQSQLLEQQSNINTAYQSLLEEEQARNQRLADRVELYNMFLGA